MLLNRSNGFGVGPTVNPCTKGLWIWNRPILGQTSDGTPINVLIIDSEGIGALNEDSSHDSKIFSLAVLLSSCFIYNSVGSIDETAIQNLSLIVNLTKNIQIRAQSEELEDYSPYFPSFLWVVRDFTLQLVDHSGDPISSKDYLEQSLRQQKGFSETVEGKNRIRRLLTTFFKERDCCTLVRPLTKEENLQNLDNLDLGKLRPEFFEQISQMRKQILGNIRPKLIDRSYINGEMFIGLMKVYIESINNGSVPNIENAWVYVCREQCTKALQEAFEYYERKTKEIIYNRLPMGLEELKKLHRGLKKETFGLLEKKAVGDGVIKVFIEELADRIKGKYLKIKDENLKASQRKCYGILFQEYKKIEQRLSMQEYKNFGEYEKDLMLLHEDFRENGPKSIDWERFGVEFIKNVVLEGIHMFLKVYESEIDVYKALGLELQRKMEMNNKEIGKDHIKEREALYMKITELERRNAEETAKTDIYQDELLKFKRDYELKVQEVSQLSKKLQEDNEKAKYECRLNTLGLDETLRNLERENLLKAGEFEKEKALLIQKLSFLERSNEELQKKDKDQLNELKAFRKESACSMKEITFKYEQMIKSYVNKVNELQERNIELESELNDNKISLENEQRKKILLEEKSNQMIEEYKEKIAISQGEIQKMIEEKEKGSENSKIELENMVRSLNDKIYDLQRALTQKDDNLKTHKSDSEKDKAILLQKLEFQQLQLKETEKQLIENKKAHEAILKALEFNPYEDQKADSKHLENLKENHKREIKALETEFDNQKKRLIVQMEQLNEKYQELELKGKLDNSDVSNEIAALREELEGSEAARGKLLDQLRQADASKVKLLKEAEERYIILYYLIFINIFLKNIRSINKLRQLEKEIEELKQNAQNESSDLQQRSEESLSQLKLFYENERERLEKRITEEKSRYDRRIAQAIEEYEAKLKEEQSNYEDELLSLREEIKVLNEEIEKNEKKSQHDLALKQQSIETLEKYLRETKESLLGSQDANSRNLEQHLNSFSNERRSLVEKNEAYMNELSRKEREILGLIQIKEVLEANLLKKDQNAEIAKKERLEERKIMEKKLEDLKIM